MKLNLSSLAFGSIIEKGGGTPSWGTELGQSKPDYKFTIEGCEDILVGMLYNSVNLHHVSLPLGKGGHVDIASNFEECHLASVFRKVYINGILIGYPFMMVLIKELSASHTGRRSIKYSDKIAYSFSGERLSNQEFFRVARKKLGLNWESCWFIYEMNVLNQDELHFKAVVVNTESSESYRDSAERKEHWLSFID
ncbi:MAG: hypothetical protein Q4E58_07770 [Prevotellaceae bacterium]|nr:hypothetical protein [Bacteroidaceae bacterium]MDO4980786.1 hypothetical protein [Prevotellaceae bacterium]